MQKVVRTVQAVSVVVSSSYKILVTLLLGWYLVGEVRKHGREAARNRRGDYRGAGK